MKKKKKGSSLIMVLAMAAIFTMISGVVATAVVANTKANSSEKHWEDMLYTCEAGVERATVKARNRVFSTLTYGNYTTFTIPTSIFPNQNISVSVKVTKSGDLRDPSRPYNETTNPTVSSYYLVESTSTYNLTSTRTIRAKLRETIGSGSLFNYTICGETVKVTGTGAINTATAPINASLLNPSITNPGGHVTGSVTNAAFNMPKFNFQNDSIPLIDCVGTTTINSQLDYYVGNGVQKRTFNAKSGVVYTVYLVDTPLLEINPRGKMLHNTMIISDGDIKLNLGTDFTITAGSIIGKNVEVSGTGNMHFSYAPHLESSDPNSPHYPLTDDNVREINEWIYTFDSSWGVSGGGTSTPVIKPGDYE